MNWARRVAQLRAKAADELRAEASMRRTGRSAGDARSPPALQVESSERGGPQRTDPDQPAAITPALSASPAAPEPATPVAAEDTAADDRFWTPDRCELLTRLIGEGLGYAAIARQLGTTKNAVVSKANRLCIERPNRSKQLQLASSVELRGMGGKYPGWHPLGAVREALPRIGTCQHPTGDPPKLTFCGKPITKKRSPYCDEHREICFSTARKKSAAELLAGVPTEALPARRRVA